MYLLLGYRAKFTISNKLGTLKDIVKTIIYRIIATFLGRTITTKNIHKIIISVNGAPIVSEIKVSAVPGGLQVMYSTPFLLKPDDTVEVKTRSLTYGHVVEVDLLYQDWAEAGYPLSEQEEERMSSV